MLSESTIDQPDSTLMRPGSEPNPRPPGERIVSAAGNSLFTDGLHCVFAFLSLGSLARAQAVSRHWRAASLTGPRHSRTLHLPIARKLPPTGASLVRHVRQARLWLSAARLVESWRRLPHLAVCEAHLENTPGALDSGNTTVCLMSLTTLNLSVLCVNKPMLMALLHMLPTALPSLATLKIELTRRSDHLNLEPLTQGAQLTDLHLSNVEITGPRLDSIALIPQLTSLAIGPVDMSEAMITMPKLRAVRFLRCAGSYLRGFARLMPHLERVVVDDTFPISALASELALLTATLKWLEFNIDLQGYADDLAERTMLGMFTGCKLLEHISFRGGLIFQSAMSWKRLFAALPNLTSLRVERTNQPFLLHHLAAEEVAPRIHSLSLENCDLPIDSFHLLHELTNCTELHLDRTFARAKVLDVKRGAPIDPTEFDDPRVLPALKRLTIRNDYQPVFEFDPERGLPWMRNYRGFGSVPVTPIEQAAPTQLRRPRPKAHAAPVTSRFRLGGLNPLFASAPASAACSAAGSICERNSSRSNKSLPSH